MKEKFNWVPGAIAAGILFVVVLLVTRLIKSDTSFPVTCQSAVESVVGPDGRSAVGGEAYCQIDISPALALKKSSVFNKWATRLGWLCLFLAIAYIALAGAETFQGKNIHLFPLLGAALALFLAGYSSVLVNNSVRVSPEKYQQIKGDPKALEALFDKPVIR